MRVQCEVVRGCRVRASRYGCEGVQEANGAAGLVKECDYGGSEAGAGAAGGSVRQ